jgi:hypothetical protein
MFLAAVALSFLMASTAACMRPSSRDAMITYRTAHVGDDASANGNSGGQHKAASPVFRARSWGGTGGQGFAWHARDAAAWLHSIQAKWLPAAGKWHSQKHQAQAQAWLLSTSAGGHPLSHCALPGSWPPLRRCRCCRLRVSGTHTP